MRRFCQSICCKGIISFLVVFNCLIPSGISDFIEKFCDTAGNYTAGSELEKNLDRVLQYLVSNAPGDGYSNYSYGKIPNKMYGLLQCRGDVSQPDCNNCSQEAQKAVRQKCPNQVGGLVWFDECFLQYDNQNFISKLDITYTYVPGTAYNTDPSAFNKALGNLMDNLSSKAIRPANKGFASGDTKYTAFNSIYAMVQCRRDLSLDDCKICLSGAIGNISSCCDRKDGGKFLYASCWIRFEPYSFLMTSAQADSPLTPDENRSHKLSIILGAVGAVILLLAMAVCLLKIRRRRGDNVHRSHNVLKTLTDEEQIMILDLQTLRIATDDFHNDNKLGQGGFGSVYKGRMQDGKEIAVKKPSRDSAQGPTEFISEVKIVAKIRHRNLVKLLGCCAEGPEKLLVYEFMSNGSLDKILFDPRRRASLDWQKRYNIIVGIARGLLYLHEDCPVRILHRDIKASNILLDENLNPKISDFGTAKLFPDDKTHVTTAFAGTYGYGAPEYAMEGRLSEKSDIFSFGVLLLEILSGRKHTDSNLPTEMQRLLGWTWRSHKNGHPLDLMDSALCEAWPEEQVLSCIKTGLLCCQGDATMRPVMSSVIWMLSSHPEMIADPTEPGFLEVSQGEGNLTLNSRNEILRNEGLLNTSNPRAYGSRNDVTNSDLEGR